MSEIDDVNMRDDGKVCVSLWILVHLLVVCARVVRPFFLFIKP